MSYRPSWIVLSPAPVARLAEVLGESWQTLPKIHGTKGYTAIVQPAPGAMASGEHELAKTLSSRIAKRHFLLTLAPFVHDPDHGTDSVDVYERGEHRGRIAVDPAGRLATHFACDVPNLTDADSEPVSAKQLRLIRPREERTGEVVLFDLPISTLADMVDEDWYGTSLMLDEIEQERFIPAVEALESSDIETRRIAATVLQSTTPLDGWLEKATAARKCERNKRVKEQLEELLEIWSE